MNYISSTAKSQVVKSVVRLAFLPSTGSGKQNSLVHDSKLPESVKTKEVKTANVTLVRKQQVDQHKMDTHSRSRNLRCLLKNLLLFSSPSTEKSATELALLPAFVHSDDQIHTALPRPSRCAFTRKLTLDLQFPRSIKTDCFQKHSRNSRQHGRPEHRLEFPLLFSSEGWCQTNADGANTGGGKAFIRLPQ